uniref:Uncharacterized protein n=1 Tax=Rhizophora mucronata TaxID=61149 RepID=A0A2P2J0W7_RHIMU
MRFKTSWGIWGNH